MSKIKQQLQDDLKTAMKAREEKRVGFLRFILAAIKQKEIDQRIELNDQQVLNVINKLAKQHHDSIKQYQQAGRDDLVASEQFELDILQSYLPKPLSDAEIEQLIKQAIIETKAESMRDMSKVMQIVKEKAQGRADMSLLSDKVKQLLS